MKEQRIAAATLACAALLALPAICGPAMAAGGTVIGIGSASCATFNAAIAVDASVESRYFDWAQGAMTGFDSSLALTNRPTHDLSAFTPDEEKSRLRQYCADHADSTYLEGLMELLFKDMPVN